MSDIIVNKADIIIDEGITLIYDGNRTGYALEHNTENINDYSKELCDEFYDRYFRHARLAFDEFDVPIVNPAITSTANHEERSDLIATLVDQFPEALGRHMDELLENEIRVKVVGDKGMFAEASSNYDRIKEIIERVEDLTDKGHKLLVLSCAYNHDQEFKKMVEQNPGKSLEEMIRKYYGFHDEEHLPKNLIGLLVRTWRPRTSNLQAVGAGNSDIALFPSLPKKLTDDKFRRLLVDYDQRKTAKGGGTRYGKDYQEAIREFESAFDEAEVIPQGIVVNDGDERVWIPLPWVIDIEDLEYECPNCDASLSRDAKECYKCGTQFE
ncbi:MAG: undecaprenyl diphosphate synthase family protein [Candidatus Diapherotrites archaeon]|nr:undecaprenyl diphosphate synthase family protein [Candidatus Diapherotrites archaeon]